MRQWTGDYHVHTFSVLLFTTSCKHIIRISISFNTFYTLFSIICLLIYKYGVPRTIFFLFSELGRQICRYAWWQFKKFIKEFCLDGRLQSLSVCCHGSSMSTQIHVHDNRSQPNFGCKDMLEFFWYTHFTEMFKKLKSGNSDKNWSQTSDQKWQRFNVNWIER